MCPDLATTFRRSTHRDLNWHENTRYATKTSGRAGMILILITKIISASGACILTNRDKTMGYVEIPTGCRQVALRIWRMEAEIGFFLTSYFFRAGFKFHSTGMSNVQ